MSRDIAARWERVKKLKREGKIDQAINLLEREARAQEADHARDGSGVAPAPFRELHKLYRKQGRHNDEVAILKRWKAGTQQADTSHIDTLIEEAGRRVELASAGPKPVACPPLTAG